MLGRSQVLERDLWSLGNVSLLVPSLDSPLVLGSPGWPACLSLGLTNCYLSVPWRGVPIPPPAHIACVHPSVGLSHELRVSLHLCIHLCPLLPCVLLCLPFSLMPACPCPSELGAQQCEGRGRKLPWGGLENEKCPSRDVPGSGSFDCTPRTLAKSGADLRLLRM